MAAAKTKTGAAKTKTGKTGAAKKTAARKTGAAAGKTKKPSAKANANAGNLGGLIQTLGLLLGSFMNAAQIFNNLTPKERARLVGAGVRNYGFIEKARDIAVDNPAFLPPNFDVQKFSDDLAEFDQIRQFYLVAEKLQTLASDSMLLKSNDLYRESLRVYNTLREQAKSGVPGAKDLFTSLEIFFKKKRVAEKPLTEAEELRKARSLINGKAEGEMVIKNVKPKTAGGVREVEVIEGGRAGRAAGKESAEFSETE